MSKLPILEGVLGYIKEKNISFCMPGHKGGKGFKYTKEGNVFLRDLINFDLTEVEGLDNLHCPQGIIKQGEELLSKLYNSTKSYFLVNGSTGGNLAMIFSSFEEGDKIIVERNCHRSVFNGIIMRRLTPIYVNNYLDEKYNAPLSMDMEHFFNVIEENRDAKGIIITYPNYYGICCDIEAVVKKAKLYNMKVLVDSAHGAHFGAHKQLPKSALKLGANMVVTSCHKTMPSLTQTAYLHVGQGIDIAKTDFYVSAFMTTSPSYLFLCSMDYGRFFLEEYGEKVYGELIRLSRKYREKINAIEGFYIINKSDLCFSRKGKNKEEVNCKFVCDLDETRYIINLSKGLSGHLLLKYLRDNKIQAEMSNASNVVLIFSPFNEEEDFKKLYDVLRKCELKTLKSNEVKVMKFHIPAQKFMPFEVMFKKKIKVSIREALNKICATNIVPYPPGVPIVVVGEIIDQEAIKQIGYYISSQCDILGIEKDTIEIVEE